MRISDWSSDVCSSDLFGRRTLDRCLIGRGINLVEKLALGDDRAFLEQKPEHDPAYLWTDVRHHEGVGAPGKIGDEIRSEEHTYELQSLMRISYDVFCLKTKKQNQQRLRRQE